MFFLGFFFVFVFFFFFSSRRRHTRSYGDWSSDVCSSDLQGQTLALVPILLKYWGNANYGLWLALLAGFNLLQSLDLGHQNYVGNQLNMRSEERRVGKECRYEWDRYQ